MFGSTSVAAMNNFMRVIIILTALSAIPAVAESSRVDIAPIKSRAWYSFASHLIDAFPGYFPVYDLPIRQFCAIRQPWQSDVYRRKLRHWLSSVAIYPTYFSWQAQEWEEDLEDDIEADLEEDIEADLEEDIEADLEEDIEADLEEDIEADLEEDIEADLEEDIEEDLEDDIEADLEDDIEADLEDDIEDDIEDDFGDEFDEEDFDEDFADEFDEDEFDEEDFDEDTEDEFDEDEFDDQNQDELDAGDWDDDSEFDENNADDNAHTDESLDGDLYENLDTNLDASLDDSLEVSQHIEEEVLAQVEIAANQAGEKMFAQSWLVFGSDADLTDLEIQGFFIARTQKLQGLGKSLAVLQAPQSYAIDPKGFSDLAVLQSQQFQGRDLIADFNHIYTLANASDDLQLSSLVSSTVSGVNAGNISKTHSGIVPAALFSAASNTTVAGAITKAATVASPISQHHHTRKNSLPNNTTTSVLIHRVGMIDTAIDTQHSLLQSANIQYRTFTPEGHYQAFSDAAKAEQNIQSSMNLAVSNTASNAAQQPLDFHGTAVASILVGDGATQSGAAYQGAIPQQPLWAASVFFQHQQEGSITTTEYLLKALDWMVLNKVTIINMSLAGPANRILQNVIESLCQQDITIVAAVGNNGPNAQPQYPAAYSCAVAVTAINDQERVYRRAVRGQHVDVAAYGVNMLHADSRGDVASSSGTSFATPLVTAYLAQQLPQQFANNDAYQAWFQGFYQGCKDLGQPGWDPVYGHGLIQLKR